MASIITEYLEYLEEHEVFTFTARVEFLRQDESSYSRFDADILDGNIKIVRENGVRRTCKLILSNISGDYIPNPQGDNWINQKFRLYVGIIKNDGTELLFPQGVYYLTEPNLRSSLTDNKVILNGIDKFGFLDGTVAGRLDATYIIPEGTDPASAIYDTLQLDEVADYTPPLLNKSFTSPTLDPTPYTINTQSNDTYADALFTLNNMLSRNIYYNETGNLVWEDDVNDDEKASAFDFDTRKNFYLGSTYNPKYKETYNVVKVIGDNVNGDIYSALKENNNLSSASNISRIGRKVAPIINDPVIYSDELAELRAEYELKRYTALGSHCTINCFPLYHLDVDDIITYSDPNFGFDFERFLIVGINIPLNVKKNMTLNVIRSVELFEGQFEPTVIPLLSTLSPPDNGTNIKTSGLDLQMVFDQNIIGDVGYVRLYEPDVDNILTNYQFISGTTDWVDNNSASSVTTRVLENIGDGTLFAPSIVQNTTHGVTVGNELYGRVRVRVTSSGCIRLRLKANGSTGGSEITIAEQINPVVDEWYDISGIVETAAGITGNYDIYVYQTYNDAASALNGTMEVTGVGDYGIVVVDLTDVYGAGNEPTLEECDLIYGHVGYSQKETWLASTLSINGTKAIATVTGSLEYDTDYFGIIDSDAFKNSGDLYYAGLLDYEDWNWTTEEEVLISSTVPVDDATDVGAEDNFTITFNQNVSGGVGYVKLYTSADALVQQWVASTLGIVGAVVTINPTSDLVYGTDYYIKIDSDAFYNINSTYFAGIADKTTWNFQAELEILISSTDPTDGEIDVPLMDDLEIVFNQDVIGDSGKVKIYETIGDVLFEEFTASGLSIVNDTVTINPSSDFDLGTDYYVKIDATAFKNSHDQYFVGISDKTTWNFTTVAFYEENMRDFFVVPDLTVEGDNIVSNPQFDSGTTDWTDFYGTFSVTSNVGTHTGDGTNRYIIVRQNTTTAVTGSHIWYAKARMRVTDTVSEIMTLQLDGTTAGTRQTFDSVVTPTQNQWYDMSGLATEAGDFTGNIFINMDNRYADAATANGKSMEIDCTLDYGILLVDLTDIFGSGNEPDVTYCDAFYDQFFVYTGDDYHGQVRAKIDCPTDATALEIRCKNDAAWNADDDMNTGWLCGTIDEYESGTTYAIDDYVISVGIVYVSLQNANTGNTPVSSGSWWTDISDIDNNEWYIFMGTALRNYVKAFPGSGGAYTETNYLPSSIVHEYLLDGNAEDNVGSDDGTASSVTYAGKLNQAGVFNDTDAYIDCGAPSDFGRTEKLAGCAYECWFYAYSWGTSGVGQITILSDQSGADIQIYSDTSGRISALKNTGSIYSVHKTGLSTNTWYHLVFNFNANQTMELFIDGVSADTDANTDNTIDGTGDVQIGRTSGAIQYWDGMIDQLRLYDAVLTTPEIVALYNIGKGVVGNDTLPTNVIHGYYMEGDATDSVGSDDGTAYNMLYAGKVNQCAIFDGTTSYIDCGTPADFDRTAKLATGCSYELWFYAFSWGTDAGLGSKRPMSDRAGWTAEIYSGASGEITFDKYTTSNNVVTETGLSLRTWYHVVGVINADMTTEMYIDGVSVGTNADTDDPANTTTSLSIGATDLGSWDLHFDGFVDGVRCYIAPLTSGEVTDLYNEFANIHPNESQTKGGGLAHEYHMDSISGTTVYDTAGSSDGTSTDVTYSTGKVEDAVVSNDSTSTIDCGTPTDTNRTAKTGVGCTYESWVYFNSWGVSDVDSMRYFYDRNGWNAWLSSSGSGQINLYKFTTTTVYVSTAETGLSLSTWYHVLGVINSDYSLDLYIDATLSDSDSDTVLPQDTSEGLIIGGYDTKTHDGNTDQCRVYTRPLETYEIRNLYNLGKGC